MANDIQLIMGGDGVLLIDDTGAKTDLQAYRHIVVREDTVISACTDDLDNNLVTQWDIASVTLVKGDILTAQDRVALKTLTLTSGSVWLVRG